MVRCVAAVWLEDVSVVESNDHDGCYELCDTDGMVMGSFTPDRSNHQRGGHLQCGPVANVVMSPTASERFERQLIREYDIERVGP